MAEYVKRIRTDAGDLQIDYQSLANLPKLDAASLGAAPIKHTHTPAEAGAAPATHTHSYAGSASAGGPANSATKVNTNLTIKLNSGSTEGTNLFTFNGSTEKTINITPSAIGAAASSHGTHVSYGTSVTALGTSSAGSATTVSRSDHVHALPALNSCTGTLKSGKGGTGLTAAPSLQVDLASTSAVGIFSASPRPGVTGTLGIGNGGTGATTAKDALKKLGVIYSADTPEVQDGAIWLKPVE
jgi:hypothetical protein